MSQSGVITFKGNPLTLAGEAVTAGQSPDFTLHKFGPDGLGTIKPGDLKGKPTLLNVVPSLDTPVCATQTKKFSEQLAELGDKINAVTVSMDTPFAQNRFCGAENIENLQNGSDYMDHNFGKSFGVWIEELGILTRAVIVLDSDAKVVYSEIVPEVTNEPNYDAALEALKGQL